MRHRRGTSRVVRGHKPPTIRRFPRQGSLTDDPAASRVRVRDPKHRGRRPGLERPGGVTYHRSRYLRVRSRCRRPGVEPAVAVRRDGPDSLDVSGRRRSGSSGNPATVGDLATDAGGTDWPNRSERDRPTSTRRHRISTWVPARLGVIDTAASRPEDLAVDGPRTGVARSALRLEHTRPGPSTSPILGPDTGHPTTERPGARPIPDRTRSTRTILSASR